MKTAITQIRQKMLIGPFRVINWSVAVLILVIAFTQLSCARKKSSEEQKRAGDRVSTVIDGDTFVLTSNQTVRIAMIDTPEAGEPYYEEASVMLARLILGRQITLEPVGPGLDRYHRILAEVFIDSLSVARVMLDSGLAMLYLFRDNEYLKDRYLPYQIRALERKVGIWSLPEPVSEDYYLRVRGSYRFHRPLCFHLKHTDPDKLVIITSRQEALKAGLSPCRSCKP
jgi:endonuclease YncB( thermonuclease family)